MNRSRPRKEPLNCLTAAAPFNDRLSLAYLLGFPLIIVVFRENLPYWYLFVAGHYCLSIPVLWLLRQRECGNGTVIFLRAWYPLIQAVCAYKEMGFMIFLIRQDWIDPLFISADASLFGVQPSIVLGDTENRMIHEFMHIMYLSYLIYVPYFGLLLYHRRHLAELRNFFSAVIICYYLSFAGYLLFPTQGPRYALFSDPLEYRLPGYLCTHVVDFLMANAALHGGCMPSMHAAVATVFLLFGWRYSKKIGGIITPLVLLMMISCVYGRYHYAIDVLTGIVLGVIVCAAVMVLKPGEEGYREDRRV
jgi:membrane-associated phospholipid phosphatase